MAIDYSTLLTEYNVHDREGIAYLVGRIDLNEINRYRKIRKTTRQQSIKAITHSFIYKIVFPSI